MKLTDIHVDRYGPLPRFTHECVDNFEVFYGPNESGKTLLLEAILKLLDPDIGTAMPHVSRIDESPTGHVVVASNGTEQKLGNGTVLPDLVDISPRYLRNIFVIRDSDLQLQDEHDFYDSVTQQIGDLHTTEIDAIQSRLVDHGRLTSVGGRGLSSARGSDNAEEVRDTAMSLRSDIRDYVSEAESTEITTAEREYVTVTTDLQRCEDALAIQEAAEILDTHATLTERLHTYREAVAQLDEGVTQATLDQLERLDREIKASEDEIDDFERERALLRNERTQLEAEKEAVVTEVTQMETTADDVNGVEQALDSFREIHTESVGLSRGMRFAKSLAITGIGFGGVAAILGSTLAGVFLSAIGGVAAGWYVLQHRSVTDAERKRVAVVQRAQDAGFSVTTIDEIAPAVRKFNDELSSLQNRRSELERDIDLKNELISGCTEKLHAERQERRANQKEKRQLLQQAAVADIAAYRNQVTTQDTLERKRGEAAQSLTDALEKPTEERVDQNAMIRYWETELEAMVADIDEDVTAGEFDSRRLAELREEHNRLKQRRNGLLEQLETHDHRLKEFDERIQALSTQPFLGESVTLQSRTVEGLQEVTHELDRLVERIERDADIAREALDIFDDIQTKEEQKITDLFGEHSRATAVFRTITDGRYTGVTYDADEKVLQVHRDGRTVLTPRQLSHGTTEQLYLAARIGLAEQLLSSEPGFFLLDDAFLPADRTRLRDGFRVLRELADAGWQILYFTAKDEVGADLVDTYGLRCRTFEPLS